MRVGYVVLATLVTLLASANADSIAADSVTKNKFTITNPDSNDTLDGVYVQDGDEKFLILHLNEDDTVTSDGASTENSGEDDGSSNEEESGSADQEARASVSSEVTKNSVLNKVLKNLFRSLVPKDRRLPDPPKVPARLRPLKINPN